MNLKFSSILNIFGSCSDRYVGGGYSKPKSIGEMFKEAAEVDGLEGIELVGTWHIREDNINEIKNYLDMAGLKLTSIIPDHFGQAKWKNGSFGSTDKNIRREAILQTKIMLDIASELGGDKVSIWPGQDGYDYCFQSDFIQMRDWFVEGIRECANHNPDMKIAIEYKIKEPRTHSFIDTAATTLLLIEEIGMKNVGVTIDVGHSLNCYENPAEVIALCQSKEKLFHMHMNDNWRLWDDDMMVGSVHLVEYLEILYWLDRTRYDGWLSMDQYPYRENGKLALQESIYWLNGLYEKLKKIPSKDVKEVIDSRDAIKSSALVRKIMLDC